MALTKETKIAKIEVVGKYKAVQVANDIFVKENGQVISETRNRYVLHPDMDISEQPQEVKDICNTAWTQEVKDAWTSFNIEQDNKILEEEQENN